MAKRKLTPEEWASMEFQLNNVQCSWPNIYETEIYRGGGKEEPTDRYTVQTVFDKVEQEANYKRWLEAVNNAVELNPDFSGGFAGLPKPMRNDRRNALKDGDEDFKDDRYHGKWVLKLSSSKTRPVALGRDKAPVVAADAGDLDQDPGKETIARYGIFYPGCFIDVIGSIWLMNGGNGQWVGCNLKAIRFRRDGEPLGGASTMPTAAAAARFDDVDDDEDDGVDEI